MSWTPEYPEWPAPRGEIDYFAQQFGDDFRGNAYSNGSGLDALTTTTNRTLTDDDLPTLNPPTDYSNTSGLSALNQTEEQDLAAQEAARQAEVLRLGALQQAEAQRQAELAQQAETNRLAQLASEEEARQAEARRVEQERLGALQRAEEERQAEAQRQAEIEAEAQRQQALEDEVLERQARAQAEQQRLAEERRQAQLEAEQREYEDQQRIYRENQARLEAERIAAENARVLEEQRLAQIEAERVRALQRAEEQRQAELAQQEEARTRSLSSQTATTPANTTQWRNFTLDNTVVDKIAGQIKAQQEAGTAKYYQGEGLGSIDANTMEMARILASTGITDINQFGPITKQVELYMGENVDGTPNYQTQTVTTFGNKLTGQEVPNTYTERQTGDAFGGTYAGSGNTGYRVQFAPDGTPIFYTTAASSNTLVNMFADNPLLGKVATAAAAYFGGPAGVAALQAAMGKSVEDIAKSALLTYAGGQIAGNIAGSTDLVSSIGADATNILAKGAGKLVSSGGKADILESFVGGAIDLGVNQITDNIPDFAGLSSGQQDFTKNVIRTAIQNGGNLSMSDLVDAAITAGTAAAKASASGTINTAINADKTINDAVNNEIDKALTFDATGSADVNAAAALANEQGYNKFTFGGKTYTVDTDETGRITNLENIVKAELEANKVATTAANLKGGEFEGVDAAVAANAARNNTVIGDSEADNPEEAAYLARQRNPTGTTFTFGGNTYTMGTSNAAVNQALGETQKNAVLDDIKNAKTFNEAFATARAGLGAGQTFTWQGKEYSTATAAERPDLSTPSINEINARNLATVTDASKTVAAQSDTAARATAAEELTKQQAAQKSAIASMEKTGLFGTIANAIQGQMKLSSAAANDYLKNNPDSPITNSVSTAYEAAGNLQKNVAGGVALLTDNKPLADAFVKSGDNLTKVGQSLGNGVVDTKNWNDTMSLVQNAQGWEKLGVIAGRIMDGTSGLGRQVEVELRQELPGLFLGGGSVKGILVATGAMDTLETAGNAALETYDDAVKKGKTHKEALADARIAGAAAGATEAAIQLTLGKIADVVIGKVGNVGAKATGRVVGEGVVEAGQEGGASLAVNAVLGQDLDVNKALTQAVLGGAVGKGTAVTTSPADIATTQTINNNITTAVTAGDPAGVNTAITNSVQQSLSTGSSIEVAVGSTVNSAITNGADTTASITTAVSTAVAGGADVTQTVTASIDSAITAGANTTTAINSTVSSAISSGADVTKTVSSSITAATSAGVNASTAIDNTVNSAVTASITNGTDVATSVNTAVSSAITTAATANADTTTAVNSAVSSAISAAVTSGADATTSINTAVTSAITTAASSNVNATTAVTTAVESAVTTAINNNVNATTAITTSVTAAVNASVNATTATTATNATADVNTNVSTAVNAAVTAAVTAGVDTNTAVNTAVNAAVNAAVNVNPNININIDQIKTTAIDTAKTTTEKIEPAKSVDSPKLGEPTKVTATPEKPTTAKSSKKSSETAGMLAGAGFTFAGEGKIDPIKESFLKTYMTSDKFQNPLEKLQLIQEAEQSVTQNMIDQGIDPHLANVLASRLGTDLQSDPETESQSNLWRYGQPPDNIDDMLTLKTEPEKAFKEGGYVAPLQMASGGLSKDSMPLPLLAKAGGALGALPRPDGRLDFRHGAHVAGKGDGQSDDIKAMLADGEFVFPADVVSALGNGSTKAGSDKLYEMMHSIRERARSKKPKDLPPPALKSPLDYLKKGSKK
jgi:hypothetical protein